MNSSGRKYTAKIKRKNIASFTDDSPNTKKSLCNFCYDNGIEINLVPYILNTGATDSNFMQCTNCNAIISKQKMKYQGEFIALGHIQGVANTSYEVVVSKRRISRDKNTFEPTEPEIPLLAGKPDTDLEALFKDRGGQIISIIDDNDEEEEDE